MRNPTLTAIETTRARGRRGNRKRRDRNRERGRCINEPKYTTHGPPVTGGRCAECWRVKKGHMKREDLIGKPAMFYVDVLGERWHRVESYGPDARCTCTPPWIARLGARICGLDEDTWKFATVDDVAPCARMQTTLSTAPTTPWTPWVGERVSISPEATALYEDGTASEWYVEAFGKSRPGNWDEARWNGRIGYVPHGTLCVRIINRRTGTYAWIPHAWLRPYITAAVVQATPGLANPVPVNLGVSYDTVITLTDVRPRVGTQPPAHVARDTRRVVTRAGRNEYEQDEVDTYHIVEVVIPGLAAKFEYKAVSAASADEIAMAAAHLLGVGSIGYR